MRKCTDPMPQSQLHWLLCSLRSVRKTELGTPGKPVVDGSPMRVRELLVALTATNLQTKGLSEGLSLFQSPIHDSGLGAGGKDSRGLSISITTHFTLPRFLNTFRGTSSILVRQKFNCSSRACNSCKEHGMS